MIQQQTQKGGFVRTLVLLVIVVAFLIWLGVTPGGLVNWVSGFIAAIYNAISGLVASIA